MPREWTSSNSFLDKDNVSVLVVGYDLDEKNDSENYSYSYTHVVPR